MCCVGLICIFVSDHLCMFIVGILFVCSIHVGLYLMSALSIAVLPVAAARAFFLPTCCNRDLRDQLDQL